MPQQSSTMMQSRSLPQVCQPGFTLIFDGKTSLRCLNVVVVVVVVVDVVVVVEGSVFGCVVVVEVVVAVVVVDVVVGICMRA